MLWILGLVGLSSLSDNNLSFLIRHSGSFRLVSLDSGFLRVNFQLPRLVLYDICIRYKRPYRSYFSIIEYADDISDSFSECQDIYVAKLDAIFWSFLRDNRRVYSDDS